MFKKNLIVSVVGMSCFIGNTAFADGGTPAASAAVALADFETPEEVAMLGNAGTTTEFSSEHATHGKGCVKFTFKKYVEGSTEYPAVTLTAPAYAPVDWSRFGYLLVDIVNPEKIEGSISIQIPVKPGQGSGGFATSANLLLESSMTLRINFKDVAEKVNIKKVEQIMFYKRMPPEDTVFYVDNIRLVSKEVLDLESGLSKAGETVESLNWSNPRVQTLSQKYNELKEKGSQRDITVEQAVSLNAELSALLAESEKLSYQAPYAFDFGTGDSPVRKGFTRVDPKTQYVSETGFGWKSSAGVKSVVLSASREGEYNEDHRAKMKPLTYFNELTQDCCGGYLPAEFMVKLPPGNYEIYLLAGGLPKYQAHWLAGSDSDFPVGPINFQVSIGGTVKDNIRMPMPLIFENRRYPVSVSGNEPLSIRMTPETAWALDAMMIYPQSERLSAQGLIGVIEREIYRLPSDMWASWERIPNPTPNPPPKTTPADIDRGYILFSRGYVENVYPDSAPSPQEIVKEIQTFATPGEYEPVTVGVYPLKPLQAASITVSDLVMGDGQRIPASTVDVRSVSCWLVRANYGSTSQYKEVPEMLLKKDKIDLRPRECQRYWITVKVPDDAKPGVYAGSINLAFQNAPAGRLPFKLEVLPFKLLDDPSKSFGMFYYDPRLIASRYSDTPEMRAALEERARLEWLDMREHGMNTVEMEGQLQVNCVEKKKAYRVDFSKISQSIKLYLSAGLIKSGRPVMLRIDSILAKVYRDFVDVAWVKGIRDTPVGPPEYYEVVTDLIQQIETERKKHPDWPEFFYYPMDEAAGGTSADFLGKMLQAIKKMPGVKTMGTQIFKEEGSDKFQEWLDVWCSGVFTLDFAGMEDARRNGKGFWCYPNFVATNRGVPKAGRMAYGFGFWRSGYSGLIPWHYQAPCGNPFNDFDASYGDWCTVYPGADGPIPTQRWEAMREGIDDYKYIYTLESYIQRAKKDGKAKEEADQAGKYLSQIWNSFKPQSTYAQGWEWNHDKFQEYRRKIADLIIAVGSKL